MEYSVGKKVFKDWEIVRKIGEYGEKTTFELRRKLESGTESALLYVITVPGEADLKKLRKQSSNQKGIDSCFSLKEYYRKKLDRKADEIARMALGSGTPNAGRVAEYSVQEHTEGIGWDILVRMEAVLVKDGQNEKNSEDKTEEVIQPQGSSSNSAASAKMPKRGSRRSLRIGVVILLVLLTGVGVWWHFFSDAKRTADMDREYGVTEIDGETETGSEMETESEIETESVTETDNETEIGQVVIWSDPNMEQLIRTGLNRPEGDILAEELADMRVLLIVPDGVLLSENLDLGGTMTGHTGEELEYTLTLGDLKWMPKLQWLMIDGQKLEELTPLGDLKYLTLLYLSHSGISDISVLEKLTNLETLSLISNDIRDISALGNLTNLKGLGLTDNDIRDISALGNLTNLEELGLVCNDIRDISALGNLTKLEKLYLSYNDISDISALGNLTNLKKLYLDNNNISDVSALENLANTDISLSGNPVSE